MLDDNLNHAQFLTNLWANPKHLAWGNGWHYLFGHWSDVAGYKNRAEWSGYSQCHGEKYRDFDITDLDSGFRPQFNASLGTAVPGLQRDYRGHAPGH